MFYSEAILSKKGPLARVWLAAHWERKLSKTQFLQTNIQFSVGAILKQDQQPMALRLSGQLLLGVVRIYSRKAKYLLEDCTEALNKIKLAFRQGEVDIPEDQRIANFESITLPDKITEFDILLPDPGLNLKQWTEVSSVTVTSSNISRPQDITIRDDFDISLNLNIGEDLLGEAFDTEDGRGLDLDLEDDIDPKTTGADDKSDSHAGEEGSVDIEIARDAPLDIPISMEDVIGKGVVDNDPLMVTDDGPELDLLLDESLDVPILDNEVPILENDVPMLESDMQMLANDVQVLEEGQEERLEIELSQDDDLNLDMNVNMDMNIDPADLILSETMVQEEMLPETQRLTPSSPLSPERHENLFQDQEVEQLVTQTRRKRKLMEDELTELPTSHIASQIKDRSDITIEPTFLPFSRKLLRIGEIRRMGASYYLDLRVPHNISPEFQHLFARKRQRFTPPPDNQDEEVQAGPSKSDLPLEEEHFEININNENFDILDSTETHDNLITEELAQDIVITDEAGQEETPEKIDKGKGPKKTDKDKGQEKSKEKTLQDNLSIPEQELVTPTEHTPEHDVDVDFDMISHHEYDASEDVLTPDDEDQPSPSGITIFDQEETQEQQNAETTFSKNTIKAMRLLRNKCREEIGEQIIEGSDISRTAAVSYDSVVGTAKRQDAVKLFFELLVLNTKDVIRVRQKEPYGDIEIICKNKLFDMLEDVPA
ncbi:5576_t:CDS:10 [Acaulospora morrowiae]|uniref:5576_t:CDS:1 n=1 Tax=Acaulospora morrowiae TaxID=94023 RepID=A0A9N9EPG5_9GLOM|nr:5576_t:CDS:10 [Acaulospora morrowiae]